MVSALLTRCTDHVRSVFNSAGAPLAVFMLLFATALAASFLYGGLDSLSTTPHSPFSLILAAALCLALALLTAMFALKDTLQTLGYPQNSQFTVVCFFVSAGVFSSVLASLASTGLGDGGLAAPLWLVLLVAILFSLGSTIALSKLWVLGKTTPYSHNAPPFDDLSDVSLLLCVPKILPGMAPDGKKAADKARNASEKEMKEQFRKYFDPTLVRDIGSRAIREQVGNSPWWLVFHTVEDFLGKGGKAENIIFVLSDEIFKYHWGSFKENLNAFTNLDEGSYKEEFMQDNDSSLTAEHVFTRVNEIMDSRSVSKAILNATSGPSSYTSTLPTLAIKRLGQRVLQYTGFEASETEPDEPKFKTEYVSLSVGRIQSP